MRSIKVRDFTFELGLLQTLFIFFSLRKFLSLNFTLHALRQWVTAMAYICSTIYLSARHLNINQIKITYLRVGFVCMR